MTNPIIADLESRYTAKAYDASKRISAEDLEVIYQAIRLSPSSINSQPWKFIVVESDEAKQRLYDTFANKFQFNRPHAKSASQTILFAYKPNYTKDDYKKVVDAEVASGHLPAEMYDTMLNGAYGFAEANTDEHGFNGNWTRAQTYIALGNTLHVLARLGIDSTTMEGIDSDLIGELFKDELDGYVCGVALAMGYHQGGDDYNYGKPKARLPMADILQVI